MTRYSKLILAAMAISALPLASSAEQELGRLFMSSEERVLLEQERRALAVAPVVQEPAQEPEPEVAQVEPEEPPPVGSIGVSGVVTRSSGNNTAWVNGVSTLNGDFELQHFKVRADSVGNGSVGVEIPSRGKNVRLKPGQTYLPDSASVVDTYDETEASSASTP
jgi:hypothetical protein